MGKAARKPYQPLVPYISKSFSYNTPRIATAATVQVGTLPAGALHTQTIVRVKTAFNAVTTNVILVGTAADQDAFIEDGDVLEGVADTTISERGAGTVMTADTPVYVTYTQTGTAATAGEAEVILVFIPYVEA